MNIISTVLFLLGLIAAYLLAIGMDPYSCGIPLCFVGAAVLFSCLRGEFRWGKTWIAWIALMVSGYFAVRMFQSPVRDFGRSDGLLLAGAVGAFWWTMSQKRGSLKWLVIVLWGLLLANIGVAIVQAYADVNFYPIYGERATLAFPSGLYLHYNHFANFLLGVGLLSLGLALVGQWGKGMRVVSALMYAVAIYGVVLSNSRGAMLGLGCGTAFTVVGWLSNLWRRKVSWAGVALIIATVLAPLLIAGAWKLGAKSLENRQGSDSGRLEFASIALELIAEKPIVGGGSRSFFFDCVKKWNESEMYVGTGDIQYVHNEYLQAAVDYGLVGVVLLLIVFSFVMFRGITYLSMGENEQEGDAGFALGAMAGLVAMGVQAFFSFVYHVLPDVMFMGICLALLARQPWLLSRDSMIDEGKVCHGVMAVCAVILGVGLIGFSVRDGMAWYILRPQANSTEMAASEKISQLQAALQVRPDFRVMGDLSKAIVKSNTEKELPMDERKKLVEQAIAIQEVIVKRVPQSYQDRLNLALMYDSAARYDESAPLYEQIVDDLDARERYYGARYHYTRHLLARAHVIWRKREPERALVLFLRAREQASRIKHGYEGSNLPAVKEEIEKCITFLEGANIRPNEGD